jgi:hypothetical protein
MAKIEYMMATKDLNKKIAHLSETKRAIRKAASVLAEIARGQLATARKGQGDAKIILEKANSVDYYVTLSDESGDNAAAAIEYGHIARNGRFVDGIHALTGVL